VTARFAPFLLAASLLGCLEGHLDTFELRAARGGDTAQGGQAGRGIDAGTGGASASGAAGSGSGLLLDDFEDQDNEAEPDGWWYVSDDGTGPPSTMAFEPPPGRDASLFAVHMTAGPTTGFGAFLGLDLPGGPFDATDFASLSFFARLAPEGELSIRFQNLQGAQYEQVRTLDDTWQEVRLPLVDFISTEDGTPLVPTNLGHLQFWLLGSQPAFDLYVDDVRMLDEP
jgi:hypothetical protein